MIDKWPKGDDETFLASPRRREKAALGWTSIPNRDGQAHVIDIQWYARYAWIRNLVSFDDFLILP
jgi:hypothetical protein